MTGMSRAAVGRPGLRGDTQRGARGRGAGAACREEGRPPIAPNRGPFLALLLSAVPLLAVPGRACSQDLPGGRPGEVVTFSVEVLAPAGRDAGRAGYRVERITGARLFGSAAGEAPVEDGRLLVPLTFQLGPSLDAGVRQIARLSVSWPGGAGDTVPVEVDVPVRRRVEAAFTVGSARVSPGGRAEVAFEVVNRGNAPDTVRLGEVAREAGWRVSPRRRELTLQPGGGDTVRVLVDAPERAPVGSVRRVRMAAASAAGESVDALTLRVVEGGGWLPGVEHVPGRVFLGSTTGSSPGSSGGMVAAVEAGGTVGAETDILLQGRYRPRRILTPRPLRREILGPEVRLRIRNPGWEAGAGDVFARSDPLAGSFLAGRGADIAWDDGESYGEVFAAVPPGMSGAGRDGHALLASGGIHLEGARVGLVASDSRRSPRVAGRTGRTQSVGGRLRWGRRSGRFVALEAGLLRLSPDSGGAVSGPAAEGELWMSGERGTLDVRARLVPGELSGGPTLGDRLFLGGRYGVGGPVDAVGRASWSSSESSPGGPVSRLRQVEGGVRYAPGSLRMEALLRVRESAGLFGAGGRRSRHTVVLSADAPAGPIHLGGRLEAGREEAGSLRPSAFHRLRASARLGGTGGWGWLALGHERTAGAGTRAFAEAEGGLDLEEVAVSGGASVESDVFGPMRLEGWSRVAWRLGGDLSVVGGVERNDFGFGGGEWGLSVGVQKGLDFPLPLPDATVSRGIVFLDRDGDGGRDPGEPGVAGVTLRKGFVEVVTDGRGRFRIRQEAVRGRPLEVDGASLPPGALVPAGVEIPRDGEARIPVVRTGALELRVFRDDDGNGRRDAGEPPIRDAVVVVYAGGDRRRVLETDAAGSVRAGALRPGRYSVLVRIPGDDRRRPAEKELEVEVVPGVGATRRVPIVPQERPVRF